MAGFSSAQHRPLTAATPMRTPVKEPGPRATATASSADLSVPGGGEQLLRHGQQRRAVRQAGALEILPHELPVAHERRARGLGGGLYTQYQHLKAAPLYRNPPAPWPRASRSGRVRLLAREGVRDVLAPLDGADRAALEIVVPAYVPELVRARPGGTCRSAAACARRRYSLTMVKVGLFTRQSRPMPRAMPRTKAVLPAPSSPYMATTVPSGIFAAKAAPAASVSRSECSYNLHGKLPKALVRLIIHQARRRVKAKDGSGQC